MAKTIAAVATGSSPGGIGIIRISGSEAIAVADRVFAARDNSALSDMKGYSAKLGNIIYKEEKIDEAVALIFRAPKSYTGEDVVELSVHGGIFIVEKALEAVFDAGAFPAEAGEFTKRAFLNGKMDLTQAEGVADLIAAKGDAGARASFNLLQGALSNKINDILEKLTDCAALMGAWVDYPDEEIPELSEEQLKQTLTCAINSLNELLDGYENGQIMTRGIDTVIAGKPNAGKSTLMNLIVGRDKSIVTSIAGTTRDIVEESVRLGRLLLHLSDTAGIRRSDDMVEAIGIQRALDKIDTAMLIIAVFDSSLPLNDDDRLLIEKCKGRHALGVINKSDISSDYDFSEVEEAFAETIYISAGNADCLGTLENAVMQVLGAAELDDSAPMLANLRQKQCCKAARDCLEEAASALEAGFTYDAIGITLDSAINELLLLTGKKANIEVINNIFSKFCVGK